MTSRLEYTNTMTGKHHFLTLCFHKWSLNPDCYCTIWNLDCGFGRDQIYCRYVIEMDDLALMRKQIHDTTKICLLKSLKPRAREILKLKVKVELNVTIPKDVKFALCIWTFILWRSGGQQCPLNSMKGEKVNRGRCEGEEIWRSDYLSF